jgi:hypothetical protein
MHNGRKDGKGRPRVAASTRPDVSYSWIDLICINQCNTTERNHQVSIMRDIYSNANMVRAWLGKADDVFLAGFLRNSTLDQWPLVENGDTVMRVRDFFRALNRLPYWTRAWVVQEIMHSQRIAVHLGSLELDWKRFTGLHSRFMIVSKLQIVRSSSESDNPENDDSKNKNPESDNPEG